MSKDKYPTILSPQIETIGFPRMVTYHFYCIFSKQYCLVEDIQGKFNKSSSVTFISEESPPEVFTPIARAKTLDGL